MKSKGLLLFFLILIFLFASCKQNIPALTEEEKSNIYHVILIDGADKTIYQDVKILMIKTGNKNEEFVLIKYYNIAYRKTMIEIQSIIQNRQSNFEFISLAQQEITSVPITFNITMLQDIGNDNSSRTITYGVINDKSIKSIKLLYNDNNVVEAEINSNSFIVIQNNLNSVVSKIYGYDNNLNEIYRYSIK